MIESESRIALPEGLAEMPPGPELAAALASVDRSMLCGFDLVILLRARNRQIAHEQAELAADMVEITACVRRECSVRWECEIEKYAAAEVAAALTLTKRAAMARLADAHWLIERLPQVWAALRSGSIDVPKARVFLETTLGVDAPLARWAAARVLPEAPELTTGQLAYRLRRLALEADPDAARKRYEEGVAERKVVRGTNPDGTGYLSGCNLPVEQAAAADERLDALARAAKRAGDGRPMDAIRADIYLGLLGGTFDGPSPVHRRGVVELTADLPTLMGLAERTAELAGWGPVIADVARQVADERAATCADGRTDHTVWRFTITDPLTGRLLHHGTTKPPDRPVKDPRRFPHQAAAGARHRPRPHLPRTRLPGTGPASGDRPPRSTRRRRPYPGVESGRRMRLLPRPERRRLEGRTKSLRRQHLDQPPRPPPPRTRDAHHATPATQRAGRTPPQERTQANVSRRDQAVTTSDGNAPVHRTSSHHPGITAEADRCWNRYTTGATDRIPGWPAPESVSPRT